MKQYMGHMALVIIVSLIATSITLKLVPYKGLFADFVIYLSYASLLTLLLMLLDAGFRNFIRFW